MAIVTKTFTTTCYPDLLDAINDDVAISPLCEQIIDLGTGDSEFHFNGTLSGAEESALDSLLGSWICPLPTPSSFQPYSGYFNIGTNPSTVVVTGVGFKPAYIIFNMNNDIESVNSDSVSPDNSSDEQGSFGWGTGFAIDNGSSIQQQCQFWSASSSSINAHRNVSDTTNCIHIVASDQNGNKLSEAIGAVVSFDNDGFTLNFSTNTMNAGYVMQYIAFRSVDTLQGPPGANGQGEVIVQNNDVSVGTDFTTLNFEGSSVQSIVDEGSGKVTITLQGGGSGSETALPAVQVRRSAGLSDIPTAWTDLSFDVTDIQTDSSIIEHESTDDRIRIKEDGLYMLTYTMVCDDEVQTRIRINDIAVVAGSTHQAGDPNDVNDVKANNTTTVFVQLVSNDFVTVQVQAATSAENLDSGAIFTVTKMQGSKGDKGDPGGATVTVQENDSTVNAVSDTLNFEGNVAVVNEGGGKTTITITDSTPVFGAQFQQTSDETVSTTNSTTWQEKLKMTTTNLPSGTYRISWYCELNSTNGSTEVQAMVMLNDTIVLGFCGEEPDDAANIIPFCGFHYRSLSGINTIDIDFRRQQNGNNVSIRSARIELWRVS